MSEGKFFFIRSKMNGLVLDVKDGIATAGQPIITWEYSGEDNQIFYEDPINNVIRSKLDDNLVIDFTGEDTLVLSEYNKHETNQKWKFIGDCIQNVEDDNLVFDIQGADDEPGANVIPYEKHGDDNQLFELNYLPAKMCHIRSIHNGKVIDIRKRDESAGAKVLMFDKKDDDNINQLWWEDKYGIIHAKMNDFVMDTSEGKARMQPYDSDIPGRQWVRCGNRIANREDSSQTLQIKDADGMHLIKYARLEADDYSGASYQLWEFDYID